MMSLQERLLLSGTLAQTLVDGSYLISKRSHEIPDTVPLVAAIFPQIGRYRGVQVVVEIVASDEFAVFLQRFQRFERIL